MSPGCNALKSNDGASGGGGVGSASSGPSTSSVRAVDVDEIGGGVRAGGGCARVVVAAIGGGVNELATVAPLSVPVPMKRPLGESLPSIFCNALLAAFNTVSSPPWAAC